MKQFFAKKIKFLWNLISKILISIFFFINVGIMIADGFPDRSALGEKFIATVDRYQSLTMLYQPWSMFAPNPTNMNSYVEAEIHFEDGSKKMWQMPRPTNTSGINKVLVADRYRIVGQETLLPQENEMVWFDIAKYVIRQTAEEEAQGQGRIIKNIVFNRFYNYIESPTEAPFIPHGNLSTHFNKEAVFYYTPTTSKVRYEAKNNSH